MAYEARKHPLSEPFIEQTERCHVYENLLIQYLLVRAWALAASFREDERGEAVEKVILTAVFAGLALAVGAIIVSKVTNKAASINLQ